MKYIKTFETVKKDSIGNIVEDLFGIDPYILRDAVDSLLSELDFFDTKILYAVSTNFDDGGENQSRVQNPYFKWSYTLFVDNNGLKMKDYSDWVSYVKSSERDLKDFPANIFIIVNHNINRDSEKLENIINFININLSKYDTSLNKINVSRKLSGFRDGGSGFVITIGEY